MVAPQWRKVVKDIELSRGFCAMLATLFLTLAKEHCIESYLVGKIRSEVCGKVLSIVMSLFETLSCRRTFKIQVRTLAVLPFRG